MAPPSNPRLEGGFYVKMILPKRKNVTFCKEMAVLRNKVITKRYIIAINTLQNVSKAMF